MYTISLILLKLSLQNNIFYRIILTIYRKPMQNLESETEKKYYDVIKDEMEVAKIAEDKV